MLNDILKLLPLQGVTNKRALPQGVASLALGYVLLGFQPVLTKSENRYKLIFKTYLPTYLLYLMLLSPDASA